VIFFNLVKFDLNLVKYGRILSLDQQNMLESFMTASIGKGL